MKKLTKVQQELKSPKSQHNKFGNYNYRSCEDILEAVKPLLDGAYIVLSDSIKMIGDRYYVKATAIFVADGERMEVSAYARESFDKKGMDSAQITGAASSYARKYALNGLLLIDDTKDADTQDNTQNNQSTARATHNNSTPKMATDKQKNFIRMLAATINIPSAKVEEGLKNMTIAEARAKIDELQAKQLEGV